MREFRSAATLQTQHVTRGFGCPESSRKAQAERESLILPKDHSCPCWESMGEGNSEATGAQRVFRTGHSGDS